jgi:hypothetical protein
MVRVDWSATPDDAVAIGELLGVMPPGSIAAYRQEGTTQVAPSSADEARLSASPKLREYLTDHIVAVQGDEPCAAQIPPIADFVHRGARVELTCPSDVSAVDLRITMLHDIHEAYRTVAIGTASTPAQSVFTVTQPQHTWTFGGASGGGSAPLGALVVSGIAALAAGAYVVARRRQRA